MRAARLQRQALTNLKTVLSECGSSMHHVTKATVYLKSMDDFATMNTVFAEVRAGARTHAHAQAHARVAAAA
jgi:2-iminobutanoate/2-iminopropanoate deaminase